MIPPLDIPLFQTLQTLPAFPFARFVQQDLKSVRVAKEEFLKTRKIPTFTYAKIELFDTVHYRRALLSAHDKIASFAVEEDVRALYFEKLRELELRCEIIDAMKRKDDEAVTAFADHLFGPGVQGVEELTDEFDTMLSRAHELHTHQDKVNAELLTKMVRATLDYYGLQHWTIRLTKRLSMSISHCDDGETIPVVKIPATFLASKARAARLLTHEVEVHALRTANGMTSPILLMGRGLAGYIATDEGLAVAMQQKLRAEESMDPGFWDAWTAALSKEMGFVEMFAVIDEAQKKLNSAMNVDDADAKAFDTAWRLCLRETRGIHHPGAAGLGFRRDHIYRSGLFHVRQAIETYGEKEILPTLFAGHAGVHHIPMLLKRNIVGRVPDFVGKAIVKEVMMDVRRQTKKRQ